MCVYPGEDFHISATTVGQRSGTVPGYIHVVLSNPSSMTKILHSQESQTVHSYNECTKLTYTLFSNRESEQLILVAVRPQTATIIGTKSNHKNLVINVSLRGCPEGFELSNSTNGFQCSCSTRLTQVHDGITCNISTQTIHRPPAVWIGYHDFLPASTPWPSSRSCCTLLLSS